MRLFSMFPSRSFNLPWVTLKSLFNDLALDALIAICFLSNGVKDSARALPPICLPFIMPLILITFVENAVKYGIQKTDKNKWIDMKLRLEKNVLYFTIRNSQATGVTGRDVQSSGKGIANTRERLKIGYSNHHQLRLNSVGDMFEVELIIEL